MSAPSSMWPPPTPRPAWPRYWGCPDAAPMVVSFPSVPPSYPPEDHTPASERPTERDLPRPPRVPTNVQFRQVEEVRYDLECATGLALAGRGFPVYYDRPVYAGLSGLESVALSEARCALIEAGRRLGRGW